jgi:hypothetical protein
MALKISISTSSVGFAFENAYAKITHINGNKDSINFIVFVYADENARRIDAKEVAQHIFTCETPTGNLMQALYENLKNQVGFENAEDC